MKEEIDKIKQKEAELVSKLKTIELPIQQDNWSIEVIPTQDNLFAKLLDMTQNAKRQIDALVSLENLKYVYVNCQEIFKDKLEDTIKVRIVIENYESDAFTKEIIQQSEASNNRIKLRQVEELPFNLIIVDDNEAIWGILRHEKQNGQNLWTNDPTQIGILEAAFESLWQKSSDIEFEGNIQRSII